MEPPTIPDPLYTILPTSPIIKTAYTFTALHDAIAADPSSSEPPIWLIFINGLGLPQAFWQPTITHLKSLIPSTFPRTIYTTTYDRQYQGLSQPINISPPPTPVPLHPFQSTLPELNALLSHITTTHTNLNLQTATRILTAHSIGVPLARLYISSLPTPHNISALLSLDSNVANIDLSFLLPDPNSPSFSPSQLPPDTTLELLTWSHKNYVTLFAPQAPNSEGLDRSELPLLLPASNSPVLANPNLRFVLRVLAHDPDTFATEGLKICTEGLTRMYIQPAWNEYNRGLLQLDGEGKGEVVVVEGAGHFVQRDRPDVVAEELWKVVRDVVEDEDGRDF